MKNRAGQCRCFVLATIAFFTLVQSAVAQFTFITNNGAITVTGYSPFVPSLTIPSKTNGYPVTTIGNAAFKGDTILTSVTLPDGLTNIGVSAFFGSGLTRITIPDGISGIGNEAFASCQSLTNISVNATNLSYSSLNGVLFDKAQKTLLQFPEALTNSSYVVPGSVSTIASNAFYNAYGITSVTIPGTVTSIGMDAFTNCLALSTVYFGGNAPNVGTNAFEETDHGSGVTAYFIPGTTGWTAFSAALGHSLAALVLWYLPNPEIISFGPSFGVHNAQFSFIISWATNATLVVDACTNLSNPVWLPISINSVITTNGTANFADPQSSKFKTRFYRLQVASSPFTYSLTNGAITITGYTNSSPSVTIPATINGYPVVAIGNTAFSGDASVTSVSIPTTVTNIGAFAFASSGLTSISIPASVIGIGQEAFNSCQNLTNISVTAGNPAFSSLNGVLFDKAQKTLLQYPAALPGSYAVPGTVSTIASNAFYDAYGITSVTIPGTVISIGNDAFANCIALSTIYIGGNAPIVGTNAFNETDFGSGVTVYCIPGTTGWAAFSTALGQSLAAVVLWYLPNPEIISFGPSFGVHNAQFTFIISWATNATLVVDACTNLSHPVWLPISTNTVTATIGAANFADPQWSRFNSRFYQLQLAASPSPFTYSLTNGAITITGYTNSSPSVTIPATINGYPVVAIGNTAFGGDTSVTSVSIPTSVTNIGDFAFTSSGLTSISIPASVIGIGREAFNSCQNLTNISVTTGNPAFSSLNGVLFDKTQDILIQYPSGLTMSAYIVPGGVTTITNYAFYGATSLNSVTLPGDFTNIGNDAFAYCVALNTVYLGGNAPTVGNNAFYQTGFGSGVTVYYLPGTTGWPAFFSTLGTSLASSSFWYQSIPSILNFAISGNQIGFTISWATNASVVVEANGNPSDPVWTPIATNSVIANTGTTNFFDPLSRTRLQRYYRLRFP